MASSDSHGTRTIFYGPVINPISLTCYSTLPHCLLSIEESGKIDWMIDSVERHKLHETLASKGHIDINIVNLKDGEFLIPGFIDTHTHAPQFPIMGTGNQYQLLDWLNELVFPMESEFKDEHFARKTYESVVRRVLDFGTTTCCYYGSLHLEATMILADIAHAYGQRAFIGKCNMNSGSPNYYIESSDDVSVETTHALIRHIRDLDHYPGQEPLVQPILTPRFALSCTPKLLTRLGLLAASDSTLRIQTHISENEAEVIETLKKFPEAKSYAGVYDMFGLLRDNTILAHAVHLTKDEVELIKERGAGISHCPTSNFNLNSGIAPIGYYLDKGVKVGLGTDVSGGCSPSMLNAIQNASIAAKALSFKKQRRHLRHSSDPASQSHHGHRHRHDHLDHLHREHSHGHPEHPHGHPEHPHGYPEHPLGHPEYPLGHPEHSLGHPEHPHGHPEHPHGHPEHPLGHPEHPLGHPEHPHGHPEHPLGHPEHPLGHPEHPLGHPEHPHADHPHDRSEHPHDRPDHPHGHRDHPHDHRDHPRGHRDHPHDHRDHPHGHRDHPHDHCDHPHGHRGHHQGHRGHHQGHRGCHHGHHDRPHDLRDHAHGHHDYHHHHDHDYEHQFTNRPLSIATLLYLATAGGAAVCGIEKQVGSFDLGKSFDALLVNVGEHSLNPGLWGSNGSVTPRPGTTTTAGAADVVAVPEIGLEEKELEEKKKIVDGWLERFLHGGDDRNIEKVYVQGRFVGGRTFRA